jgi:hypothetical protein
VGVPSDLPPSAQVDRGEQVADGGSEEEEEQGVDADAAAAAEGAKPKEAKVRKYQLYVDGIREHMTPAQLAEVFAPYGESLVTVPLIKNIGTVLWIRITSDRRIVTGSGSFDVKICTIPYNFCKFVL